MKFFVDTADIDEIRDLAATGLLDGVTTNPSLIAKSNRQFLDVIEAICSIVPGPVSAEVTANDHATMLAEGKKLARIAKNVAVKVPLTVDGLKTCKVLSDAGTMGKDTGDDFREGKVTLPVILAYARGNGEDRVFWKDAIEGRRATDADLAIATQLIQSTRAVDDTLARARHYGQRAIDALGIFPSGKAKAAMVQAVEFAIARAY